MNEPAGFRPARGAPTAATRPTSTSSGAGEVPGARRSARPPTRSHRPAEGLACRRSLNAADRTGAASRIRTAGAAAGTNFQWPQAVPARRESSQNDKKAGSVRNAVFHRSASCIPASTPPCCFRAKDKPPRAEDRRKPAPPCVAQTATAPGVKSAHLSGGASTRQGLIWMWLAFLIGQRLGGVRSAGR